MDVRAAIAKLESLTPREDPTHAALAQALGAIRGARERGNSWTAIAAALAAGGVKVSVATLREFYARGGRERRHKAKTLTPRRRRTAATADASPARTLRSDLPEAAHLRPATAADDDPFSAEALRDL